MSDPRRRSVPLYAWTALLLLLTSAATSDAQGTQIASNRFKREFAFDVEPFGTSTAVRLRGSPTTYLIVTQAGLQWVSVSSLFVNTAPATWLVERIQGETYVRFKNVSTGTYLHAENPTLQVSAINPAWWSAMWTLSPGSLFSAPTPPPQPPPAQPQSAFLRLMTNRFKSDQRFEAEPADGGRIRLRTTAGYVSVINGQTGLTSAIVPETGTTSSEWYVSPSGMDAWVRLSSHTGAGFLNIESGSLRVGQIQNEWWSALWLGTCCGPRPSTFVATVPAPSPTTPVQPPPVQPPPVQPNPVQPPPATVRQIMTNNFKTDVKFEVEPIGGSLTRFRLRTTAGWLTQSNGRVGITPAPVATTPTSSSEWLATVVSSTSPPCKEPYCPYRLSSAVGTGFLNNEKGPLVVGYINDDWWSARWSRVPGTATPSTFVPALAQESPPPAPIAPKQLANRFNTQVMLRAVAAADTPYVNLQLDNGLFLMVFQSSLAGTNNRTWAWSMWRMEPVLGNYVRLRNRDTGDYLHIENGPMAIGRVDARTLNLEWWSAMWLVVQR